MAGPYSILRLIPWLLPWPSVPGRVLRYWITRETADSQRFYHAGVWFKIGDGESVVAISNSGTWNKPWKAGELITIKYCPTHPEHIEVCSFGNYWGLLLTVLALVAVGIAVVLYEFGFVVN